MTPARPATARSSASPSGSAPAWLAWAALALLGLALDAGALVLAFGDAPRAWDGLWLAGQLLLAGGLIGLGLRWRRLGLALRLAWAALLGFSVANAALAGWPWLQARWQQPAALATLTLSDAGRTLQWRGAPAASDTERLRALLAQAPQLRRVDLQGSGGLLPEALRLAGLLRERRLDTRVSGPCQGPCAALFLAGARRQLLPEGQLGWQQLPAPSLNPLLRGLALQRQQQLWLGMGLSADFVQRALLPRAPRWWQPEEADLLRQGGLGEAAYPLDLALPAQPGAQSGEYLLALRSHRLWRLLDTKLPGTLAQAQALLEQQHAGGDDAAALLALHRFALERERRLLAGASVEMRDRFLDLQRERLQALGANNADCHALLAGDPAVRRRLSAELARQESVWLEDAAVEPPPPPPSRHVVALDAEVLRKTWNRQGLALLDRLGGRSERAALDCAPAVRLIEEVRGLQPAQRKPAQRRLFD